MVPGLCRTAVEAAFTEAVWRRELRGGRGHAEIEDALEAARVRLNPLAALALTGDTAKGGEVLPRLRAWSRRCADTYQALNKGAHAAHGGDLRLLIGDARDLVAKIRAGVAMTPHELLAAARGLMQRPDAPAAGIWPRAAALLARQAIEAAMGKTMGREAPGRRAVRSYHAVPAAVPDGLR